MRKVRHRSVTISNASESEILPEGGQRVGIVFSPPSANAYEVNFTDPAVLGTGIRIAAGTKPFEMFFDRYGSEIKGSVRAIADTAPVTVGITEVLES